MWTSTKSVFSYIIFNLTRNVIEVLLRQENVFAPRLQVNDLAEATSPVSEKQRVAAEVYDRLAAVVRALWYVP